MREIKTKYLIHIFAVLHAVIALACRLIGIDDEILLTLLTMTLILLICIQKGLSIENTVIIIVLANIVGFIFGKLGAEVLSLFIENIYITAAIASFITTEILGFGTLATSKILQKHKHEKKHVITIPHLKWIIIATFLIFALRLIVIFLFSQVDYQSSNLLNIFTDILSNTGAIVIIIALNIIFVRWFHRKNFSNTITPILVVGFILACSILHTLLVRFDLPFNFSITPSENIIATFISCSLLEITIFCITYIVTNTLRARSELKKAKSEAILAQYQYIKLKQQVNPHFLFNSLNILDGMVQEGEKDKASLYIQKLASLYRYMLRGEEQELVSLREEVDFVQLYVDLVKLRFPKGVNFEINIPEENMNRLIVPGALQLLTENAIKHNITSASNPLSIKIECKEQEIIVSNNLVPKLTKTNSTGLGNKYIRKEYKRISGKDILIEHNKDCYRVTLPLL